MKAKVIKDYIDKHTRELHTAGETVTLTDERFAEIAAEGRYVEEIREPEPDDQLTVVAKTGNRSRGQEKPNKQARKYTGKQKKEREGE